MMSRGGVHGGACLYVLEKGLSGVWEKRFVWSGGIVCWAERRLDGCMYVRSFSSCPTWAVYILYLPTSLAPFLLSKAPLLLSLIQSSYPKLPVLPSVPASAISTTMPASTLHTLVLKASSLIHTYPRRFSDIEAAKLYISSLSNLSLTSPLHNKAAFLIATRAFEDGEFYLDTPPPDRQALRSA